MWGWAILAFLLGAAARRSFDAAGLAPQTVSARQTRARIAFGITAVAFLALIAVGILNDGASLPDWGWAAYSAIVAPRFVACASGFLVGVLLSGTNFLRQVAAIVLPLPSWAAAAVIGVVLVAAMVFTLNPGLLDSLQSFKAGGIEATFSRTANVREAEIHAVALTLTLDDYLDFEEAFNEGKPRPSATIWFETSPARSNRLKILRLVFHDFVNPLVAALSCLNEKAGLEAAKRQDSLADLAISWQYLLLQLNASGAKIEMSEAFEPIIKRSRSFVDYVKDVGTGCSNYDKVKIETEENLKSRALDVGRFYAESVKSLQADEAKIPALTAMEPYLVGVVGDLTALMFGPREKVDFLERIAKDYPRTDDGFQTGIVSLFYQLVDAKVQSEDSWPIENVTEQLDYALRGADYFVASSAKKMKEASTSDKDKEIAEEIFAIYNRNVVRLLAVYLSIYNQRSLRGEPIGDADLHQWNRILGRLIAISHAQRQSSIPIEGVPEVRLDADLAKLWPRAKMPDRHLIDANIALALSLVLHHRAEQQATASECASARYYLKGADQNRRVLASTAEISKAEELRLEQFLRVVGYRIGSHCSQRG